MPLIVDRLRKTGMDLCPVAIAGLDVHVKFMEMSIFLSWQLVQVLMIFRQPFQGFVWMYLDVGLDFVFTLHWLI